jgi:hypothetical protein
MNSNTGFFIVKVSVRDKVQCLFNVGTGHCSPCAHYSKGRRTPMMIPMMLTTIAFHCNEDTPET